MGLSEILDYLEEMKRSVENYNSAVEEMDKIKDTVKIQNKELLTQAEQLSLDRKRVSEQLKQDILDGVCKLAMPNGDFNVEFMSLEANKIVEQNGFPSRLNESGMDRIEFLFSANSGVSMQPLKNSISGGELSRLLLVFKKTLAGKLDTLSLIFDEIDSGIGGVTAKRTGEFISEVAKHHQVICITHLAQIAAVESKHFFIEKVVEDDKTLISIRELSQSERRDEIARMLAGEKSTTALKHAEELLNIK
jgi:DNA repair protein RecN (Recombination protein N)